MKKFWWIIPVFLLTLAVPITAQASSDGLFIHTLSKERTVTELADYYDLDGELVAAINDLSATSQLKVGSRVKIPLEPRQTLSVRENDTLWRLSQRYQVDVEQLMAQNDLDSSQQLFTGQLLTVALAEEQTSFGLGGTTLERLAVASRGHTSEFIWPLKGTITSRFGSRSSGNHHGLDIATDIGSEIKATRSGTVIKAGWLSGIYGYGVIIDHGDDLTTLYAHASAVEVKPGDQVTQGQTIALVGVTGRTTGPHVHFEVRLDDEAVEPLNYLP